MEETTTKTRRRKHFSLTHLIIFCLGLSAAFGAGLSLGQSSAAPSSDTSGWKLSKATIYAAASDTPITTTSYIYDKDGRLLSTEVTEDGERYTALEYIYDKHGNLVSSGEYASSGSVEWRSVQEFDKQGNILSSRFYSGSVDEPVSASEYTYDAKGRMISAYNYDENSVLITHTKTDYTDAVDGSVTTETTHYDCTGGRIGEAVQREISVTDENGNVVRTESHNLRSGTVEILVSEYVCFGESSKG